MGFGPNAAQFYFVGVIVVLNIVTGFLIDDFTVTKALVKLDHVDHAPSGAEAATPHRTAQASNSDTFAQACASGPFGLLSFCINTCRRHGGGGEIGCVFLWRGLLLPHLPGCTSTAQTRWW